jgi:hypothetical protein
VKGKRLLIAAGITVVIVGACAIAASSGGGRPRAAAPECADANQRVQQYKAPGQQLPLSSVLQLQLAAERRPVKIDGWLPPDGQGKTCFVNFRVYIGNERTLLSWVLDPQTGQVRALDDTTKKYSGW